MRSPLQHNIAGITQHITERGNNRQVCFFCDEDRFSFLEILRRLARRRAREIHVELIGSDPLS